MERDLFPGNNSENENEEKKFSARQTPKQKGVSETTRAYIENYEQ